MFLLGDVFIRNFYSIFDYENQQVKLALNKHAQDQAGVYSGEKYGLPALFYIWIMVLVYAVSLYIFVIIKNYMTNKMYARVTEFKIKEDADVTVFINDDSD